MTPEARIEQAFTALPADLLDRLLALDDATAHAVHNRATRRLLGVARAEGPLAIAPAAVRIVETTLADALAR
ncbi:hypothetical protein AB1K54_06215 [Microbacterium sp. BWT-B31]|uniref:hypothetical protein n=1 Tax=Microbacterium sp. BWT-B31 TaxID=3232072 RepID=UPI00352962FE